MPARHRAGAPRGAPSTSEGRQAGKLQAGQVRAMFDRIAGVYDPLNTLMTAGLHHRWRARAAQEAQVGPGSRGLDVAPGGEVIGSDFAEGMLDRARAKAATAGDAGVRPRFEWADAMELPYTDGSFDAATVGFGARNFDDLGRGLAEMARVVRPGGRVVVLEITNPTRPPLSLFYGLWFDRFVPVLGHLAGALGGLSARMRGGAAGSSIADAYTY